MSSDPISAPIPGESATVLVVDDSPENRYVVRRALSRAGMKVTEAGSAAEGEKLATADPDLIILDVNLPDISGFELCRRLKADPATSHIPVVHLSQSAVDHDAQVRGLEGGADAYLTEPIHASVLVATVRALLRMRDAEDKLRQAAVDAERMSALAHRLASARTERAVLTALIEVLATPYVVSRAFFYAPRPWSAEPDPFYTPDADYAGRPSPASVTQVAGAIDEALRPDPDASRSLYVDEGERDWIVLPLIAYGHEMGTLLIEFADGIALPTRNQIRLGLAADRCAESLERARLFDQQRAIALELQWSLLPVQLPEIDGMTIAAEYRPGASGTIVGGDFYDVFPSTGGWTAIIGDVCGRGPVAAARTGLVRYTAREAARHDDDPAAILAALAKAIEADKRNAQVDLISAIAMRVAPDPHGIALCYSIAGHPLPILITAEGEVSQVGSPGPILGLRPDATYGTTELLLRPGDTLFLYTDGLTESRRDRVLFGEERLMSLLTEITAGAAPVPELAWLPIDAAVSYNQLHDDDMATLVLRAEARRAG